MLNFQELAEAINRPGGGFSVRRDGTPVTSGYAVSTEPQLEEVLEGPVSALRLAFYASTHWYRLGAPGAVLGGWRDPVSGRAYLDISRSVDSAKAAYVLAAAHGQLAYYDIAKQETVRVA